MTWPSMQSSSSTPAFGAKLYVEKDKLQPLYTALPKNEVGRLEPSVVRYALHRLLRRVLVALASLGQDGVMRNTTAHLHTS